MRSLNPLPRRSKPSRHDPAPSRLKYRMQRWMLTPGIRLGLRFGVPLCLVSVLSGAYLADEVRRDAVRSYIAEARATIQERPEFMVNIMAIDGADVSLSEDIREIVALDFPISSFDLDVEEIRSMISQLDPVKSVSVRVRPGGILQVDVQERLPVVIWRNRQGLALLDDSGTHVAELGHRSMNPDLPLIAGRGADKHVAEALRLFVAARPLGDRLRGLIRIGERRWDVVLDRGQRIMLPVADPVRALERVIAVGEVHDLLERDVAAVDMRLEQRPTIRMNTNAVQDWWRIREMNGGGS